MLKTTKKTVALITGAASRIGRVIATCLAAQGIHIIAHYNRSSGQARALVREIERRGGRAWALHADLRNDRECMMLVRSAKRRAGRLDILVNNASVFPTSTLRNLNMADFYATIQVNTLAPILLCREFAGMIRCGAIVNLLDSRIVGSDRDHAGYILTKHMLAAATRLMALEYAPDIRVNAVAPGLILTSSGTAKRYGQLSRSLPLKRYGNPVDVARAVLFLVQSEFVTGQCIYVDGGRQARENIKMENVD